MKIRFEEKQDIPENDLCVVIQAKQLSDQAREVMEYDGVSRTIFDSESSSDPYQNR